MKTGTLLLGLSFFISKLLGLLRDTLLASQFGAGTGHLMGGIFNLDIYYAAFRIPDFLFNLLSYGILSAAFVPLFIEIGKKDGDRTALRFTNEVLHTMSILIAAISLILFVIAPYLINIFVPGFSPEEVVLTARLTRIMLLTPLFFTIGSIAGGVGNATQRFSGIALAPVIYNLGILGGIYFLAPHYGVVGVAWGVTCGAFFNMLVQLPPLIKAGYHYVVPTQLWSPQLKEMITLSLPRIFGMSVMQLSLLVDTIIASTLTAGSITIINFAINLESLPMSIVGISIAVVSFGTLAHHAADGNLKALADEVRLNLRRILMLLIPITLGMFVLRYQIVSLIFKRGLFTAEDATITATTLGIFLGGLVWVGMIYLLGRGFYAMKNTKTPVIISATAVALNMILSLFFTKVLHLDTYGLALANSLADFVNATLLIIFLSRKLKTSVLDLREALKYSVSAIIMAFAAYGVSTLSQNVLTQAITATCAGIVVYAGMGILLKSEEIMARLPRALKQKIGA